VSFFHASNFAGKINLKPHAIVCKILQKDFQNSYFNKNKFDKKLKRIILLHEFFTSLIKKGRGIGPMKPWQPFL